MLLPDVNVWLALTFDSHVHHPAAKAWFDALSGELCFFCRYTKQNLRFILLYPCNEARTNGCNVREHGFKLQAVMNKPHELNKVVIRFKQSDSSTQ